MARVCRYCPALITTTHPKVVRCGAAECKRAWKRDYMRQYQRDWAAKHGEWANVRHRAKRPTKSCADCGKALRWSVAETPRCVPCSARYAARCKSEAAEPGRRAREAARSERERQLVEFNSRLARARRTLAAAAAGSSGSARWPFAAGRCRRCGEWFVCRVTNDVPAYCSRSCGRLDGKARRRALERGVKVTPGRRWRTFYDDDWVCQLCKEPTDRDAPRGHDDEPTVDHRVPLSKGGAHAPENWQTAHRRCNSLKRDLLDFMEVIDVRADDALEFGGAGPGVVVVDHSGVPSSA